MHYGYVETFAEYARLLWQATHVVSCAYQDFFGISMCEAIYCGCLPIMPRRLNYPDLIPADMHTLCLYEEGNLVPALQAAFIKSAPPSLREAVDRFDWSIMAPYYDAKLEAAVAGSV